METLARIEGMRPFLIHSERYIQVYYSHPDEPETIYQTRLGAGDLPEGLKVGDTVKIYSVLGVVAEIRALTDDEGSQ